MSKACAREVRLWSWQLDQDAECADLAWWRECGQVSEEEITAAQNRRHPHARLSFLAGRALARRALSAATGVPAHAFRITPPAAGKPLLCPNSPGAGWHFNIAHSGPRVVCAVARMPIGVDIEPLQRPGHRELVASARLRADEVRWIKAGGNFSVPRFTALWCMKEAYAKAIGDGLALSMRDTRFIARSTKEILIHALHHDATPWHCQLRRAAGRYWVAVCAACAPRVEMLNTKERHTIFVSPNSIRRSNETITFA